jgi:hypothetical protein
MPHYRGVVAMAQGRELVSGKARSVGVKVTNGRLAWIRRISFAAVLLVAAITPSPVSSGSPPQCQGAACQTAGTVRWIRSLPGAWVAENGPAGTTPGRGQAYAALGEHLAAVGAGMTVSAYLASNGRSLWTTDLTGFRPGSAIVSVRVWPGVVTVGVEVPAVAATGAGAAGATGSAAGAAGATGSAAGPSRDEAVLRAATGQLIRVYPAAQFGGAVAADLARTVIVGPHAVVSYANRTGKVVWSRSTGTAPQAWQEDGGRLYVSVSAAGYEGTAPVTSLRRIGLVTGAERIVRPRGPGPASKPAHAFAGSLGLAFDGVVLFTGAAGITAYSGSTGRLLWSCRGALPDTADMAARRIYLISGSTLIGVNPQTGDVLDRVTGVATGSSSGLYGIRDGTILGLDDGGLGKAWGYDAAAQRVLWTSRPLPWPHYFVDLSGIGGSAPPWQDAVLLATCAQVGPQPPGGASPRCIRPELAVLNR